LEPELVVVYVLPTDNALTPRPPYVLHTVPPVIAGVIVTAYPYGIFALTVVSAVAITPPSFFLVGFPDVAGETPGATPVTTGRVVILKGAIFKRNVIAEIPLDSPETATEP